MQRCGKINSMNIYKRCLFLLVTLFTLPSISFAADIGSLEIQSAQLSQDGNEVQIAFSIKNISDLPQEVAYGIRMQEVETQKIFEVPVDTILLTPLEEVVRHAEVTLPQGVTGTYDTFLLSRDEKGLVSVLEYSGRTTFTKTEENAIDVNQVLLKECQTKTKSVITCIIENHNNVETINVNYIVNKGSIYGKLVTEGTIANAVITDDTVSIDIMDTLIDGDYTYRIWLTDKIHAQNVIINIEQSGAANNTSQVFNSSITEGGAPMNYLRLVIIILPAFLLFALLYFALRRPGVGIISITTTGLLFSGVAFAAITLVDNDPRAHVFNGLSLDSENTQFVITFNKTEYQPDEQPQLAITFQDIALPNNKPSGGTIDVNINGGAWQPLVTSSDGPISIKTIPSISTTGTNTLNFRSPDLCGGVFGKSFFNFGIFGTTECLFSMPIVIVSNEPPTTPIIGGNCLLGVPCNIGIVSTDTDGGQLCYEAQWPSGTSGSAGCATEGNPVSIQYTFNSCDTAGTTVTAQATDSSSLQSPWGIGSVNIPNSITCTIPCSHCAYDGTDGVVALSSLPPFLPPNGIVEVSWDLTNVATCTIAGRTVSTGEIVHAWDWDTIRNNNSQSSILSEATEYTLTCTDLNGAIKTDSLLISTIPIWQEF